MGGPTVQKSKPLSSKLLRVSTDLLDAHRLHGPKRLEQRCSFLDEVCGDVILGLLLQR